MYRSCYVSQATGARRVFDFAGTTSRFDFLRDHVLCGGMTFGLNLSPNARNRVIKAITDGTLIVSFLEGNGNSQVAFFKLNFPGIIDDGAVTVAAEFEFPGAQLGSLDCRFCHCADGGERHRFTLLAAAGAENGSFMDDLPHRTEVRCDNFLDPKRGFVSSFSCASAIRKK